VSIFDDAIADSGPIEVPGSACLPTWRIGDIADRFDVFFSSYSFQEMEPYVVDDTWVTWPRRTSPMSCR
jgi:hypothetical protein